MRWRRRPSSRVMENGPTGVVSGLGRRRREARKFHCLPVMDEVSHLGALGIEFGAPKVNIDPLRGHKDKDKVIGKLTGGLAAMAKMRKVTTVRGYGSFVGASHVEVEETSGTPGQEKAGTKKVVAFKKCIIARRFTKPCACRSCQSIRAWSTAPAH